jgi:DNA-binding CsgD family transcriptional regulator
VVILNILSIAASAFYLYLFVIVRRMKIQTRAHKILSLLALALFQWNTLAYFVYNIQTIPVLRILLPVSCIGMFFVFPLNYHFAYSLSNNKPFPVFYAAAIYLPALTLSVINIVSPFSLAIDSLPDGTVRLTVPQENPLNLLWILYAVCMWFIPLVYYVNYYRQAVLNRQKKQAALLIRMLIVAVLLVTGEYVLNPLIPGWNIPSQSPVIFSVWIAAMVYAIWKYGFLKISPGLLAEKILDSVEDVVLLYDREGNLVYKNRKAKEILGYGKRFSLMETDPVGTILDPVLAEVDDWKPHEPVKELTILVQDPEDKSNGKRKIDMRLKPLFDRFEDPLGLLLTGTLIPRLKDLLSAYRLSKRESEVLEYLAAGRTIQETAEALFITERTVKAHITNIYEKTGATNRVELLNMVKPAAGSG